MDHAIRGHRAVTVRVLLRAVAILVLGVWGVVKLAEGDWFIGGVLVACVLLGAQSLVSTIRRARREERRSSTGPGTSAGRGAVT